MKRKRLANIYCQLLVKKKKKYTDRFALNNIVYSEEKYLHIWQWNTVYTYVAVSYLIFTNLK